MQRSVQKEKYLRKMWCIIKYEKCSAQAKCPKDKCRYINWYRAKNIVRQTQHTEKK